MWGTVRRIESFGVFVGIDGTKLSGLLHISNTSRQRVGYPDVRVTEDVQLLSTLDCMDSEAFQAALTLPCTFQFLGDPILGLAPSSRRLELVRLTQEKAR